MPVAHPACEPYEEDDADDACRPELASRQLVTYYLSRDRLLGLLQVDRLPAHVLAALQGQDVLMASAILSNAVGQYLVDAIAHGNVKTLPQLTFENRLQAGVPFIYDGHTYGNGFSQRNKTPLLSLREKLDGPLIGKQLVVEFSKGNLVNDTAMTRMQGSTRLFVFGYIADMDGTTIRAVPYAIGDLVERGGGLPTPFVQSLELRPEDIDQFAGLDEKWTPKASEFSVMRGVPEQSVKELLCQLLGEPGIPNDWGGEESDVFSANLGVNGRRQTAAFLLKGPSRFHPMKPTDLGRNGDQLYRLFNIPADVFVIQHCHSIGPAVRKQALAFALQRSFTAPCRVLFVDGMTTARLLRAHGEWPTQTATLIRRTRA
ncbi:hypothetical protein [Xanthomonas nasturtii]|uniref:hypothetical protein n=1 Tax=Xanthomonas nasturtii TaxID=1843581 RepID=UPI002B2380F7|nr:hypothetical protein [Xanthomonas nasturtii]